MLPKGAVFLKTAYFGCCMPLQLILMSYAARQFLGRSSHPCSSRFSSILVVGTTWFSGWRPSSSSRTKVLDTAMPQRNPTSNAYRICMLTSRVNNSTIFPLQLVVQTNLLGFHNAKHFVTKMLHCRGAYQIK